MKSSKLSLIILLLAITLPYGMSLASLQDRTVKLASLEINYIKPQDGQSKLEYEIIDSQKTNILKGNENEWILQFYNKSNFWKLSNAEGKQLSKSKMSLLEKLLNATSEIGEIQKKKGNNLLWFSLKKPENGHFNFEHSALQNNCFEILVFPHGVNDHAYQIHFCTENKVAAKVVEKYRTILENKILGKKIYE